MLRRTILFLAALTLLMPLPAAAADGDPVAVVRELYRVHGCLCGEIPPTLNDS